MKKILLFTCAALAVCAVLAKPKKLSKAEIEKQDKANWGGVDYSAAPDGENSVANDLAQMRSMTRGEAAKMKKLYDFCYALISGAKAVDQEPESVLGDTLKELSRPIDPTPPRTHSNMSATPAQKLGFKSLQGAKKALSKFGKEVRPKMANLLKTEIEARTFSSYNRLVRVVSQSAIKDGALVTSLKKVDAAWGKYLKILDQIGKGTDKWKYYPAQLRSPDIKKKLFADVLKESGLDCALDADGRMHAKSSRALYTMDNYFKRATDAELKNFADGVERCYEAHNAAADNLNAFKAWFVENGMTTLDPYPREFIKELYLAHADYIHKNRDLLTDCRKVLAELRDESKPVGQLRKCKGFSPNKAFFVRSGPVSERPPSYVRRMNELIREVKIRFGDAVEKRINTAGRIQL
jgi:hypothetical protein